MGFQGLPLPLLRPTVLEKVPRSVALASLSGSWYQAAVRSQGDASVVIEHWGCSSGATPAGPCPQGICSRVGGVIKKTPVPEVLKCS